MLGATPKSACPKRPAAIQTPIISGEEYRQQARMQKDSERRESWNLRNMILRPQHSDPWNPDSAFSSGTVCMAWRGRGYLAMSDATNNTDSAQALRKEMMPHRLIRNDNAYMRHLQDYIDAKKIRGIPQRKDQMISDYSAAWKSVGRYYTYPSLYLDFCAHMSYYR